MSQKEISEQSNCDHVMKILDWELDENAIWRSNKYGCTRCDIESDTVLYDIAERNQPRQLDHSNCDKDPCFGCKAKGLQLNTGDAGRDISDKSWNDRLAFYRRARADGIQPNGTHPVQVEAAYKASETLGKAYDADTMVRADKVNTGVKEVMKEIGDI